MVADEPGRTWEFAHARPRSAPGVASMVGYRALETPGEMHRGMPSSTLTFIVSLDDGVEAAESAEGLVTARPNPLVLGGLQVRAAHIRQRRGQAGVQLALHPLASRALFGMPSAELCSAGFDGTTVLGRRGLELRERVGDAGHWREAFAMIAEYLVDARTCRDHPTVRPEVAYAWHLLQRSRGRASISSVAERVELSARHLTTLFPPGSRLLAEDCRDADALRARDHADRRVGAAACANRSGGRRDGQWIQRSGSPEPRIRPVCRHLAAPLGCRRIPKHSRRRPPVKIRLGA